MPRDNQRSALYRWENRAFRDLAPHMAKAALTLDECDGLVRLIWRDYVPPEFPPPVTTDGRSRRTAFGNQFRVSLPRWARSYKMVCHEVAHSIICHRDHDWWKVAAAHGPEYARLLVEIYAHYLGMPKGKMITRGIKQRPRRVRFAPLTDQLKPIKRRAWSLAAKIQPKD